MVTFSVSHLCQLMSTSDFKLDQAKAEYEVGQLAHASQLCEQILDQDPEHLEARHLLGVIRGRQGEIPIAIAHLQQVLEKQPRHLQVHYNLATLYHCQENLELAIFHYRQCLAIKPIHTDACAGLGIALKTWDVQNPEAYYYLGRSLALQRNLKAAISFYQHALTLKPDYIGARFNLAHHLFELHQLDDAIVEYQEVLRLKPDYVEAHYNLAHTLLLAGKWTQGWAEYEWRLQRSDWGLLPRSEPLWNGKNFINQTLLLYAEQGFGDTLQFIRYAAIVKSLGGTVIVAAQQPLLRLFATVTGIDQLVDREDHQIRADVQAPLMSLPYLLGTTETSIPRQIPYVQVEKTWLETRHLPPQIPTSELVPSQSSSPLKIGITWASYSPAPPNSHRSATLTDFLPLLRVPAIAVYSLQKELSSGDAQQLSQLPISNLSHLLTDFADTAAVIWQLDLVITIDTAVAHLAGALGKPVWVLLPFSPDWRWMLKRQDSPWYPTARLFRQSQPGDWQGVIDKVKQELFSQIEHRQFTQKQFFHNGSQVLAMKNQTQPAPAPSAKTMTQTINRLGITWPLNNTLGWGIYGFNLTLQLLRISQIQPILFAPPAPNLIEHLTPLQKAVLKPVFRQQEKLQTSLKQHYETEIVCNFPVIYGLNHQFIRNQSPKIITENLIGIIFFETTKIDPKALNNAQAYSQIITGSNWNEKLLKNQGISQVKTVHQGIDPCIFHVAPRSQLWLNRFVIFSGGKLEYRKGQDIVIAAFKEFHTRHPDALLITAWHNYWPQYMTDLDIRGYVKGVPEIEKNGQLKVTDWLINNGLLKNSFIDIGLIPNHRMGQIMREAHVGIFPNRCEGGTNLVAMECMACGIPTILSANTGHLDIIRPDHCYALNHQTTVKPTANFTAVQDWGESDPQEIIETLETIYQDYQTAQQRGKKAAEFMQDWTWEKQVIQLLQTLNF